jgi:small GTP-binding protein
MIDLTVVFMGSGSCGKTSIIKRATAVSPLDEGQLPRVEPTIGVGDCIKKDVCTDTTLKIWDLSGSERFRAVCRAYLTPADYLVYCVDLSKDINPSELEWVREAYPDKPTFLVGTKDDIAEHRVSNEDLIAFATRFNIKTLFTTSAKQNDKIALLFDTLHGEAKRKKLERDGSSLKHASAALAGVPGDAARAAAPASVAGGGASASAGYGGSRMFRPIRHGKSSEDAHTHMSEPP